MLLQNALVVSYEPYFVEKKDIRIIDDKISEVAETLKPLPNEEIHDLKNHIVMPGLICGHHHLYSALARGMPSPSKTPKNFVEVLEEVWWKLDRALSKDAVEVSTYAGGIDAVKAGTTCIIDHHASPSFIKGSLSVMKDALERIGLRSVLCYEITDRNGADGAKEGIEEHDLFLAKNKNANLTKALIGGHASFTMSDDSLKACSELMKKYNVGMHIHVCEDAADDVASKKTYGDGAVERLEKFNCINSKTIFAHGIHLTDSARKIVDKFDAWILHNPSSNMNNNVGYSDMRKIKKLAIGTDGMWGDMFREARIVFLKARDAGSQSAFGDAVRGILGTYKLASDIFEKRFGSIDKGAEADVIILDYKSPTPLTKDNFFGHLMFGMDSKYVKHSIVAGKFVMKNRELTNVNDVEIYEKSNPIAKKLWDDMKAL